MILNHFKDNSAITLDDVVVFRGPTEAANKCIWAHELLHVEQYRRLGINTFADICANEIANHVNFEDMYSEKAGFKTGIFACDVFRWHGISVTIP